jgi:hypothetical protein
MSAPAATGWSAGARRIQVSKRNAAGYPVGMAANPDSVANNTTLSAHVIQALRSLTHPEKTVTRAFDRADMKIYGQMYLGVEDFGEGSFELSADDEVFDMAIKKAAVDNTIATDMAVVPGNEAEVDPPAMFLSATVRKQLRNGTFWFDNHFYNNALINKPKPADVSQNGGESPNPLTYNFAPSLSERLITGHLFADTALDVLEDEDTYTRIRSTYPLTWTTFKGNGVATTIQLPYLPVLSGATGAANNIVTLNGETVAVTSINTTSGLVTLADAGDAGDWFLVVYQTNFRAS